MTNQLIILRKKQTYFVITVPKYFISLKTLLPPFFKIGVLGILLHININIYAQKKFSLYTGMQSNLIGLTSENYNITNKPSAKTTVTPLLGLNFRKNNFNLGIEFKFFKVQYNNYFRCIDSVKLTSIESGFKGRFPQISIIYKQKLLNFKQSQFNILTLLNLTNNSTPFDEKTILDGSPDFYLQSQKKAITGWFYSFGIGLEYQLKLAQRRSFFAGSNINSNFNRTMVEETNTILYPAKNFAHQFLKANGKSLNLNAGLIFDLN